MSTTARQREIFPVWFHDPRATLDVRTARSLALLLRTRYAGRPTICPDRRCAIPIRMSFVTATTRAASPDLVNRRLVSGLLLSIVFHVMLLLLRFGVPGLGLPAPFKPRPVSITIVPAETAPAADSAPPVMALPPPAPVSGGMQLLAPVPRLTPAPPVVARVRPVKPRRISRPQPPREPVEPPTRVIAQDRNPHDSFVVPLPQPPEAAQKTPDPNKAQDGSDDGADRQTAQLAETQRREALAAGQAAEAQAKQAEEQENFQAALRQKQLDERAAQQQAEQVAAREKADELARAQLAQAQLRREQADQLAAGQRTNALALQQMEEAALRQKTEESAIRQQAEALAVRQQAKEFALKQKAEEFELRQKAAALAARQRADELARRKAAELALEQAEQAVRQQAEQAARQQAEQTVRQQAEQSARQQAEQVAAAAQRERERAAASAPLAGAGNNGAGAAGSGVMAAKNLLGSDVGNRVRELTRGIDLLGGAPPQPLHADGESSGRRVVVGNAERDVPLRMYVDSFRQKIERNGGLAFSPQAADRVRTDPLVSVAIRSDGSVEEVTILRSSGQADTDNAVRRIIRLNARYSAFPPNIASRYDVIVVRRIWSFAETLTLVEELR
jgi:hypothetical protein